jgi:hypothetical protein
MKFEHWVCEEMDQRLAPGNAILLSGRGLRPPFLRLCQIGNSFLANATFVYDGISTGAKKVQKSGPRRDYAEALCGRSAFRLWELGGMPRPQLKLSSPRVTRGDHTMLVR